MNATAAQTKSLEWLNRLRANPKIPFFPIRMVAQLSAN